ncbi:MAG: glycosyltransferase family 2 protein [Henriciella sp.]
MTAPIKVSIIIAAYEAADYIGEAIASCLAQTEPDFEVIIVDDASAETLEPAVTTAAQQDPRIRFFRLEQNSGPSGARNKALHEARGKFVAILDADDTMKADRLETMLATAASENADIIVDNMLANHIDSDFGKIPFLSKDACALPHEIDLAAYIDPLTTETYGQALGYLKPLIRRGKISDTNTQYDTSLTNSEDFYFIADLLASGAKMILIPYVGYIYTIQAGSISHRLRPEQTAAILKAERAFQAKHNHVDASADFKAAAKRRLAAMVKSHQFETLIDDLRRRAPFKFIQDLLRTGVNLPAHVLKLGKIAAQRLG